MAALKQIREREYATSLVAEGFPVEGIWEYGFAFEGKKVLIDGGGRQKVDSMMEAAEKKGG